MIMSTCRLFLLDMDGTLYLGDDVIDGAIEFVNLLRNKSIKYIYLTNNSSRAGTDYVNRLHKLGFPCETEDVFTSSMATIRFLHENHPGKKVFPVCTRAFETELAAAGIELCGEGADIVLVGFDTELSYDKLSKAVHFLRKGADFIAANPDFVCPMSGGEVLPDCGSICALLTASTGAQPYYIGKPNRNMVDIISSMTGIPNGQIACVGDRLYTDIALAKNAGAVSVLVMSGETTKEMLAASDIKPDFVFKDVKELGATIRSNSI